MIRGTSYGKNENNYYRFLHDFVELDFLGDETWIVMFKCIWYDIHKGMKEDHFQTISIDTHSQLNSYEPFIFALQSEQYCYVPNVSEKILTSTPFLEQNLEIQ